MVWPTEEELGLLKKLGVGIVHNPQSNMKLASGVAPVPEMLKQDLPVGLGTDGAASNNDLNLWEEMDTAAKLHKLISNDPKVMSAEEAFEMATIRGARALHLEKEIGSIEKGKRADLVIVDLDDLNQTPYYNIYSDLVYADQSRRRANRDHRRPRRDARPPTADAQRRNHQSRRPPLSRANHSKPWGEDSARRLVVLSICLRFDAFRWDAPTSVLNLTVMTKAFTFA